MSNNQKGFAAIEAILVAVVVVIIGFVGWYVYKANKDNKAEAPAANSQQATGDDVPPINNAQDLDKAKEQLNSADVDGQLDSSEIDSALSQ